MRNAIHNEEIVSTDLRNYRQDGTMFWNHLTIAPVRDEDGEISNFVGFQEDTSERKERELRYNAIFNQTYQFTGLLEPDGTLG